MEDVHVTHAPGEWGCNDDEMTYIGVYDGHGGRDTVDFLEGALHLNIAEELNRTNDKTPIHTKIEQAFLMTDAQSRMAGIETSGATVCVTLIKKHANGRKITIHSANAGDARAVLSCQPTSWSSSHCTSTSTVSNATTTSSTPAKDTSTANMYSTCLSPRSNRLRQQQILIPKAHRLTYDHKADNDDEIERIEEAGGFFLRNRVLGIMAVARSLGDHGMKEYIIGRPFVSTTEIDLDDPALNNRTFNGSGSSTSTSASSLHDPRPPPSPDNFNMEFVIVACDGVWDVIDDQVAVDLVRNRVKEGSERDDGRERYKKTSAKVLCDQALEGGSTDNITIIIAWL